MLAMNFLITNTTCVHIQMVAIGLFHPLEPNGHVIKISCMANTLYGNAFWPLVTPFRKKHVIWPE